MFKKIVVKLEEFGSKDFNLATKIVEVAIPKVPKGYVGIRVAASGIEASDVVQMSGGYGVLAKNKPETKHDGSVQVGDMGCEGVGVIESVGADVDDAEFSVGQSVCWFGYGVSFREYVVLPATKGLLKVPSAGPEWTALPVSAMTAIGGLEIVGKIKPEQTVLVTGAAGGTGHIAVQWAKHRGCKVAGTCGSEDKKKMLLSLGCDVVVNYRTSKDLAGELKQAFPQGFDCVYDGVGGKVGNMAKSLLAPQGIVVGIGNVSEDYSGKGKKDSFEPVSLGEGQKYQFFFMPSALNSVVWPSLVSEAVVAITAGKIKIVMDSECKSYVGMEGVYQAQNRMREGNNIGKIYVSFPSQKTTEQKE